jgi:hypothetical protein
VFAPYTRRDHVMPLTKIPSRVSVACIAAMLAGCPEPTGSEGDTGTTVVGTEDSTSTETTDGGCPVGIEGCPCSDALSCFPGLECVDGLCAPEEPVEPCPVGSAGCPCTNAGTCDPGSVCEDGVCTCTPGEFGCACLDDGGCFDGLDCTDGLCEIPELISEAANGWGPVTCWTQRNEDWPGVVGSCWAARGDVFYPVRPACEVAQTMLEGQWMPWSEWPNTPNSWPMNCADGLIVPAPDDLWHDDTGCYLAAGGVVCMGRIGHLWIDIYPECAGAPAAEFDPWGNVDFIGCAPEPVPPPTSADIDEWRCGMPINGYSTDLCMGRIGSHWTIPRPPCLFEPGGSLGDYEPHDGWSVFTCL